MIRGTGLRNMTWEMRTQMNDTEEMIDGEDITDDDDEMIDVRQRKKRTHPAVIVIILSPLFIFISMFLWTFGSQKQTVREFLGRENEVIEAFGLSDELQYEIEELSLMHLVMNSFYVLELKVDDFEEFAEANQHICTSPYKFEIRSLFLPAKNYKPREYTEENRYTVYYSNNKVYISIWSWEASSNITEIFFDLPRKEI